MEHAMSYLVLALVWLLIFCLGYMGLDNDDDTHGHDDEY